MMRFCRSLPSRVAVAGLVLFAVTGCGEERATGPNELDLVASTATGLVQCPTNETLVTEKLIDPLLGGTVSLGGTSLTLGGDAISLPTLITLTIPAGRYMEIDLKANRLASFLFDAPVTVTIDYSRCNRANTNQAPLKVWQIDPVTKQRLEDMGGIDDKVARSITFTTDHFSAYAIAF